MPLQTIDIVVIFIYIALVYGIAFKAKLFMRSSPRAAQENEAIQHYLAGKTITFWEALLSILATEFSALAFLMIPTYVYFSNMDYLRFVIGAIISRFLVSMFFLPKVYGKGLTIFEIFARGINHYKYIYRESYFGKKTFAAFYLVSKLIGVSVKLTGASLLVSEFFDLSILNAIILISLLTYVYIMLGGLKSVVRTDMLQAVIFIIGGILAHFVVGKMSPLTWGELFSFGWDAGKFNIFNESGFLYFIYGIIAGIAYDAATHGVDQDLIQKLLGAKDERTAKEALKWSALGSFIINMLFLTLGVILWAYYTKHGQTLPPSEKIFSDLITNHFPTPFKGIMIASILAASMSTLDSSINAMSTVLWNDLLNQKKISSSKVFIRLDNLIITLAIIIIAYLAFFVPHSIRFGLQFSYLSTAPLLAFFISRLILGRYLRFRFNSAIVFLVFFTSFLGMGMNYFRFGFNPQLTTLWGVITTIVFIWVYSKFTDLFEDKEGNI